MTENFKILAEFVKDISSETPDIQSYIFVKENISRYKLNIDINSKQDFINGEFEDIDDENDRKFWNISWICKRYF